MSVSRASLMVQSKFNNIITTKAQAAVAHPPKCVLVQPGFLLTFRHVLLKSKRRYFCTPVGNIWLAMKLTAP